MVYTRPAVRKEKYERWREIAKRLGYKSPIKLADKLFELADTNPALCSASV